MKLKYKILVIVGVIGVWLIMGVILNAINASVMNDSRHIRTFSGVHTLVWKDTLWRLEPVELGKAGAAPISGVLSARIVDCDSIRLERFPRKQPVLIIDTLYDTVYNKR